MGWRGIGRDREGVAYQLVDDDGLLEECGHDLADGPCAGLVCLEEVGDILVGDLDLLLGQDA